MTRRSPKFPTISRGRQLLDNQYEFDEHYFQSDDCISLRNHQSIKNQFDRLTLISSPFHNSGIMAVLGMYVPFLCSIFPNATGYNAWVNAAEVVRGFFRPCIAEHMASFIPDQPRDLMDVYLEKVVDSKDDPSLAFDHSKFPH